MLITTAPIVIPVNTANLATESVAVEAALRPQIPKPAAATENSNTKNTTEFSDQAKSQLANGLETEQDDSVSERDEPNKESNEETAAENTQKDTSGNNKELQADELKQIQQLQNRDREVRTHEQAHSSVGGNLAGAPNLSFTTGPDGQRYAVSGEVSIDVSSVPNDPAASIRKFELVQRAALAPANPSSQDRKVASQAASSAVQSRSELNLQRLNEKQQTEQARKPESAEKSELKSDSTSSSRLSSEPAPISTKQTKLSLSAPSSLLENINPVRARRQAAQLNQKIAGSGALETQNIGQRVSISA